MTEPLFRPLTNPNIEALEYPFSYISDEQYTLESIVRSIPGETPLSPGTFPSNITEYYWIHEGINDEEEWYCLCRLNNGFYIFYTASCDYTGFDCQGNMRMYISANAIRLFYHGLTEHERSKCITDLTAVRMPNETFIQMPNTPLLGTATIRLWHNNLEIPLTADFLNRAELAQLHTAIRFITSYIVTPGERTYYDVRLPLVYGIDHRFIERFTHDKKVPLRLFNDCDDCRIWDIVIVSFSYSLT